jgi:hypothetical protein
LIIAIRVELQDAAGASIPGFTLAHCNLQFGDHHTADGCRNAVIEVLRGVFGNWWQQGADSVCTFNWENAPPDVQRQLGYV